MVSRNESSGKARRQGLFGRNVRAFLQVKGKVNKGLLNTLREEPARFLAYNNGLCCTAAEVRLEKRRGGQMGLAWVKDFQIVNGGQTTASIYHAMKKERLDVSRVTVQVKLTVLRRPEDLTEVVPLIAKYANSQNKVNAADLAANGKFHQDLEALSRSVFATTVTGLQSRTHWYYERARGSYLDDKARQGTPARGAARTGTLAGCRPRPVSAGPEISEGASQFIAADGPARPPTGRVPLPLPGGALRRPRPDFARPGGAMAGGDAVGTRPPAALRARAGRWGMAAAMPHPGGAALPGRPDFPAPHPRDEPGAPRG